jgi:hypothetical protein
VALNQLTIIQFNREDIFKLTTEKGSLHTTSNDYGVRVVNFALSKDYLPRVQCSHTELLLSTLGFSLMGKHVIRLIMFS